jgi:hypothetical protein
MRNDQKKIEMNSENIKQITAPSKLCNTDTRTTIKLNEKQVVRAIGEEPNIKTEIKSLELSWT